MNWRLPFSALKSSANKLRRRAERALSLDVVRYQGLPLPPGYLRSNGKDFRDNPHFVDMAGNEAHRLVEDFGLQQTSDILDIGCGAGSLPIGLMANDIRVGQYNGLDINPAVIQWCTKYITKKSPNFKFHLIHVANKRYNPDGAPVDETFVLPFKNQSFDLIYLNRVFTNMEPNEVFLYCKEVNRLLREEANVFLTAYIEEDVPPFEENPANYKMKCIGPLHVARYSRENFYTIVQNAGLKVEAFYYEGSTDGQSIVHLRHA